MSNLNYIIGFDEAHKPRGRINGNYSQLKELLEQNGFICQSYAEFPITRKNLAGLDILVVPCPDFSKFSKDEISQISKWVKEDGGGIVMLSHAGGDKGRRSNLSELAEAFGMAFENDQIIDYKNNFGLENMPEVKNFTPHPITEGLGSICFRAGCSLSTLGLSVVPVVISSEDADPFSSPLVVASEQENGRAVGLGSYEIFRDKIAGGITQENHSQLALNIFNWVKTEYRKKIKTGEVKAEFSAQNTNQMNQPINAPSYGIGSNNQIPSTNVPSKVKVSSDIQISDKSDLANLLKGLLSQVDALKQQIQSIIDVVVVSEEEIIGMEGALAMIGDDFGSNSQNQLEANSEPEPPLSSPPKMENPLEGLDFNITKKDDNLTPLPSKPPTLLKKPGESTPPPEPELDLEDEKELEPEPSPELEPEPKVSEEIPMMSIEEIQAEMESLQSKLKSIDNLKKMVQRKFDQGKMKEKAFNKQIKRLENDKERCFKRIDELEEMIKKL